MPRALWSGSIAFGLVNAPVRMYPAIDEQSLEFHLVHKKDSSRIGYQKICKKEGKPVPDDEIVKAYEVGDKLVFLEPEDFEAAESEGYKAIEIVAFVPHEEIDPIYFGRSYYLGPDKGAEKVYALLVEVMEDAELSAVARYVFHDREHLGALRIRDGVLVLVQMHFADEIRPTDGIRPKRLPKVDRRELAIALDLVERFGGKFDPSAYEDRYRERLLEIIKAKRRGGETKRVVPEKPQETPDLMEALKESLERHTRDGRRTNGRSADDLEDLTVGELNDRARSLGIEGRSKMSKRELVSAIQSAGGSKSSARGRPQRKRRRR
jgi:DNA end-binding protein Ku